MAWTVSISWRRNSSHAARLPTWEVLTIVQGWFQIRLRSKGCVDRENEGGPDLRRQEGERVCGLHPAAPVGDPVARSREGEDSAQPRLPRKIALENA